MKDTTKSKKEKSFIVKALQRYVVVQEFSIEAKTTGGLTLSGAKLNSNVCLIKSMPDDTKLSVKPGDYVLINQSAGFLVMFAGIEHKIVGEMDILALYDMEQLDITSLDAVNHKEKAGMNVE